MTWMEKVRYWYNKWPVFDEQPDLNNDSNGLNLYKFYEILNQNLRKDDVLTWDSGSSLYCSNQSLKFNNNSQRSIGPLAQSEMGAGLGFSIGISLAREKKDVICIIGDGSFNTNIQSLAVVNKHDLPIKIFVLENGGFLSIRNSQDKFYEGRRMGTSEKDGYFFPRICLLASAYNITYEEVSNAEELDKKIKLAFSINGPRIIEVHCKENQEISPGITAKKNADGTLEQCDFSNMAPFLSEEEYNKEMIKD